MKYTSYVFIRKDIPLADQIVQVGHACLEAGNKFPLFKDNYLVVLEVKSQDKLLQAAEFLDKNGIQFTMFYEPDDNLEYTAICTQSVGEEQKELFSKYRL